MRKFILLHALLVEAERDSKNHSVGVDICFRSTIAKECITEGKFRPEMRKAILPEKRHVPVKLPGHARACLYPNRCVSVRIVGWEEIRGILDTGNENRRADREVGLELPFRELLARQQWPPKPRVKRNSRHCKVHMGKREREAGYACDAIGYCLSTNLRAKMGDIQGKPQVRCRLEPMTEAAPKGGRSVKIYVLEPNRQAREFQNDIIALREGGPDK